MLQKIFPQGNSAVPEIRFQGFTGEWGKFSLSQVCTFNPRGTLPEIINYVDLESVVGTEILASKTMRTDEAPSRAQRLAKKGDLFFQTVRPYQKNNYLFVGEEQNFVFSTGYAQMRPLGDGHFLLSLVQKDEFVNEVLNNCTGTSYPAISSHALGELTVYVPCEKEQEKIGNYFRKLDELITLERTQFDKLKQIKQACLSGMFV
jgi:type I restriction enzyme S subunit